MHGARGLTDVPTDDLVALLRHLHRGDVVCPITAENIARVGLQHRHEALAPLRGLDRAGVHAVIVCALAERRGLRTV